MPTPEEYIDAAANDRFTTDLVTTWPVLPTADRVRVLEALRAMGRDDYAGSLTRVATADRTYESKRTNALLRAWADAETQAFLRGDGLESPANLPQVFWDQHEILERIRTAAWSRFIAGDALLGAVLARLAWLVLPTVRLPAIVGAEGTLDLIVSLVGVSGTGKSASMHAAAELMPHPMAGRRRDPRFFAKPLGSGEGVAEQYLVERDDVDPDGNKVRVKVVGPTQGLFSMDEGEAMKAQASRNGSTLMTALRSAWSGQQLGQANASAERSRDVPARSYRFALVTGFQPAKAAAVLGTDEADGGTPQRWLWFNAHDPTAPPRDQMPELVAEPLGVHGPIGDHVPTLFDVDASIIDEVQERAYERLVGRSEQDPLNSHQDLLRLKVAALLALLTGQGLRVDHVAWKLAGMVVDTSAEVRSGVIEAAQRRAAEEAAERVDHARTIAAVQEQARADSKEHRENVKRAAEAITRHINGETSCQAKYHTHRCLANGMTKTLRPYVEQGLEFAMDKNWIEVSTESGRIWPVNVGRGHVGRPTPRPTARVVSTRKKEH